MSSTSDPGAEAPVADAAVEQAAVEEAAVEEAAVEEPVEAAPRDEVREAMVETLREHLGDDLVDAVVDRGDVWVRVKVSAWRRAAEVCRSALRMDYFCFLSGIDWLPNPTMGGKAVWDIEGAAAEEDAEGTALETGVAGGDTRFQVFARLASSTTHFGITLKADLDDAAPTAPSWVEVYKGADWHEREAWEMYGFDFEGHPGLRHLYLPTEFEGHPLRKDFPLLSREVKPWPGLVDKEPIPGEGEDEEATAE